MPVIPVSSPSAVSSRATLLVSDILASTARDLQNGLQNDSAPLVDYCDRIHLELCRLRKWNWLLSAPKYFVTERDQPYYWIGASGSAPAGTVDTGLNLTDFDYLDTEFIQDASAYEDLTFVRDNYNLALAAHQDTRPIPARPLHYQYSEDNPLVLGILPPANDANVYTPSLAAPHSTTAAGGALAARTYYLRVTLVDSAGGESEASDEARQYVPASNLLTVKSPNVPANIKSASGITYSSYSVYASASSGNETKQGTTTLLGTDWVEPGTGLTTTGANAPTSSTLEPLRGQVIRLRYLKQINRLTAVTNALQIPDIYRDVVIAGVNWLGFTYLDNQGNSEIKAARWQATYEHGKSLIKGTEYKRSAQPMFISPDPVSSVYRTTLRR